MQLQRALMASNNATVVSDGKRVMLHSCSEVVGAKSREVGTVHNESPSQLVVLVSDPGGK